LKFGRKLDTTKIASRFAIQTGDVAYLTARCLVWIHFLPN